MSFKSFRLIYIYIYIYIFVSYAAQLLIWLSTETSLHHPCFCWVVMCSSLLYLTFSNPSPVPLIFFVFLGRIMLSRLRGRQKSGLSLFYYFTSYCMTHMILLWFVSWMQSFIILQSLRSKEAVNYYLKPYWHIYT